MNQHNRINQSDTIDQLNQIETLNQTNHVDQANHLDQTNRLDQTNQVMHESYMQLALEEAGKGVGWVSPNPMVGAVIVKNGHIIGKGYHRKYGELHAERNALADCKESAAGADIYVTLEPCCHYGKTPPCTEAIIEAGIKRVFIGSTDPNPLVAGKGIRILEEHGIEVHSGILEEQCLAMNKVFFHFIQNQTPYVIMKYAMTLDGKIATYAGLSKWITGKTARENVHKDRYRYSAIMVGIGTVLADDPSLTARIEGMDTNNPVRVICDSTLRTPLDSKLVKTAKEVPTIIATTNTDQELQQAYIDQGCEIIVTEPEKKEDSNRNTDSDKNIEDSEALRGQQVDLKQLMIELGKRKIDSLIIEGGAGINYAALQSGIVDHVQAYIAPKIFGGKDAKSPVGGQGVCDPAMAYELENRTVISLGEDLLIEGDLKK